MSNQSDIDYDKQFQDDLAKATALSLEQQALDDYRRAKKYGTAAHYYNERSQSQSPSLQHSHSVHQRQQSTESAVAFYAQLRTRYQQSRDNSNETSAAAPMPPHRRHSEANNNVSLNVAAVTAASRERSKTPPAALPESDLISFSSPTAKEAQPNTFEKLIEDLQKLQTSSQQTALVPFGPVAAAPITSMHAAAAGYRGTPPSLVTPTHTTAMYAAAPAASGGGAGVVGGTAGNCMQLVPFTPAPSSAQQQKVPLTSEELQKLYNMPLQQQQQQQQYYQQQQHQQMAAIMPAGFVYPSTRMGFVPSVGGYVAPTHAAGYTQSAPPTAAAGSAFTPPQFPPTPSHYGFQYGGMPPAAASYYGTAAAPSVASSVSAAAVPMPLTKSQSAAAAIVPNGSNSGGGSTVTTAGMRRQTPPARKPQRTGNDLIDLNQEDDSRVSVLEAFDPLLNADEEVSKK
ncbi:PREDICTED: hormone receptor 4-like [Rhagoletis zephyria]|uniref:hormone receptor 4-like n=1 Tax=Rhagoletis zephyria TaxID=28612 RepID=UPI00081134FC|nr:PREDICTED: hormone receptor 4-like [Rhagoletis zephyria]